MPKIALISDLHFGVHKGSKVFVKSQENFFINEYIPYLVENKINDCFILGDIWDNRESTNNRVMNAVYHIFREFEDNNIKLKVVVGNHDTQYKTNISHHTLKFLSLFKNVEVIDSIKEDEIYGLPITIFPWQVDEVFMEKEYAGEVAFGHFNINGMVMTGTFLADGGQSQKFFFDNFKKTFSGHFHTWSDVKSVTGSEIAYLGSPYHLTRNDINSDRGFVVFDTETLEWERVWSVNPLKYLSITYPDSISNLEIPGNIIDVHASVSAKFDSDTLVKYITSIETNATGEPVNVNIIPNYTDMENFVEVDSTELDKVKSIPEMVAAKISTMDLDSELEKEVNAYISDVLLNAHKAE